MFNYQSIQICIKSKNTHLKIQATYLNVSNCAKCIKLYQIDLTDISCGNFSSDGKEKKSPNHEKQDESG